MGDEYLVKTHIFEGPLETLLSLIEKRKLFINDISLAQVADDYIEHIRNFEEYQHLNGMRVVKFFLHVSKDEQKRRFLDRIDDVSKNWKFNPGDLVERARWDDYQVAYQQAIAATATKEAPWYIIPADDKGDMRLLVSAAILWLITCAVRLNPRLP